MATVTRDLVDGGPYSAGSDPDEGRLDFPGFHPADVVGWDLFREVMPSMMRTARARAGISVEMFVTMTPAWAPWVIEGERPSWERTTPTPPPPKGDGRGQAEQSVTRTVSPWVVACRHRAIA